MPQPSSTIALATRLAGVDDIALLRDLAERIWRVCYAGIITPEQIDFMLGWMYGPAQIKQELRDGVVWELALVDDVPVGFFSVSFGEAPKAKLNRIYLLPERQGAGLGQALLRRAHEVAIARGATEIYLQVNKQNTRAIRAYECAGYRIERAAVFEIGQGFVMDDYVMHRSLVSPDAA